MYVDGEAAGKWTLSDLLLVEWVLQNGLFNLFNYCDLFQLLRLSNFQAACALDLLV